MQGKLARRTRKWLSIDSTPNATNRGWKWLDRAGFERWQLLNQK
jgi:hypothetical protein